MHITTKALDHHGIVCGFFDELEIGSIIDEVLPKVGQHKLAHSIVIKAMILNCLGSADARRYLNHRQQEGHPVDALWGGGSRASDLTHIGSRLRLDKIYEADPTQLFMKLSMKMMEIVNLKVIQLHCDDTNFSVHGDYEPEDGSSAIELTYGHAKDKRYDLKRFSMGMIVNQYGMPLFTQAYSGNSSDKETIVEAMKRLKENIEFPDDVYFIADSSLYSEDNVKALKDMKWITRIPSTLNLCKELLISDIEFKEGKDSRYSFYKTMVEYGGIKQKWVVVHSTEMHKRKDITLEKKIKKIVKEAQKELKELKKIEIACEEDARAALERWKKGNPYCLLETVDIFTVSKRENGKKGRPKKGEKLATHYVVDAKAIRNEELVQHEKKYHGRFIIGSSDLNLDSEEMLVRLMGKSCEKYYF